MSNWVEFYRNRIDNAKYQSRFIQKYNPFINLLKSNVLQSQTIAEYGCGTGMVTSLIQMDGKQFFAYDLNQGMLNLAGRSVRGHLAVHDVRDMPRERVDLIHSHGVLEHFDPEDIRRITANQRDHCRSMIHYVPSSKYGIKSYGDERLLSKGQWQDICKPDSIIEFNNGYDLILTWGND